MNVYVDVRGAKTDASLLAVCQVSRLPVLEMFRFTGVVSTQVKHADLHNAPLRDPLRA